MDVCSYPSFPVSNGDKQISHDRQNRLLTRQKLVIAEICKTKTEKLIFNYFPKQIYIYLLNSPMNTNFMPLIVVKTHFVWSYLHFLFPISKTHCKHQAAIFNGDVQIIIVISCVKKYSL